MSKKFVLLEGLEYHNRFFSDSSSEDPTKLENGKVVYRIIGYADSVEDAQAELLRLLLQS